MTKIGHDEAVTTNREIVANHLNVSIFHHILSSRSNMTAKEALEKYGQPVKFVDSFGIMNYSFPREMGVDLALKVTCHLSKEPQWKMCICFAKSCGEDIKFKVKDADRIVVSKLHILKEQYEQKKRQND